MKAFSLTIFALVYLTLTNEASANVAGSLHDVVDDFFFDADPLMHHEVHGIISSFHAENKHHSMHPKFGSGMEELLSKAAASEKVNIEIIFTTSVTREQAVEILLESIDDIKVIACYSSSCSVEISVDQLEKMLEIDAVHWMEYAKPISHVEETVTMHRRLPGKTTSEGVFALVADEARDKYAVNGDGILVGIIGDTFDCGKGYANDTRTGDLPSGITEISIFNATACMESTIRPFDQARALMQVIYDVAPGVKFAFQTGIGGTTAMASGIQDLWQVGCDIIVSTISYPTEPFFQDGILAQAVDQVVSDGTAFFAGAGEYSRLAWDAPSGFVPVTVNDTLFVLNETEATARYHPFRSNETVDETIQYHQFGIDGDGQPIISQRIAIQNIFTPVSFVLQWDEPSYTASGGLSDCQVDLDLYFLRNNTVVSKSVINNIGRNPIEAITFEPYLYSNTTGEYVTVDMVIVKKHGESPKNVKLIPFAPVVDVKFEFATNTPTLTGLKNAKSVAAVGVAPFFQTPKFGVSPPVMQFFSSVGGVPILFDKFGNRLTAPEIRNKPNFVGPDSVLTTFYTNGPEGLYYGTPCAAGHVAGVAALILQLKGGAKSLAPLDLYGILERTAIDMDDNATAAQFDTGFDFSTGHGLVNASAALDAAYALSAVPTGAPLESGSYSLQFAWSFVLVLLSMAPWLL